MPRHEILRDQADRAKRRKREGAEERADDQTHPPPLVSSLGNAAVQRLLRSAEADKEHPAVDGSVESAIEAKRGGGSSLDADTQERLGGALQTDLAGVRVHDDSQADTLNQAVQADAFTVGNDIFFREGKYQPASGEGEKLLAHELTHVVQQRDAPAEGGGLRVSDPDDAGEREAEAVAGELTGSSTGEVVARQGMEEEEDAMQMSPHLDRQEEEEDAMQMSPHLDRQEMEEEEDAMQMSPHLDRDLDDEAAGRPL